VTPLRRQNTFVRSPNDYNSSGFCTRETTNESVSVESLSATTVCAVIRVDAHAIDGARVVQITGTLANIADASLGDRAVIVCGTANYSRLNQLCTNHKGKTTVKSYKKGASN